MSGRRVAVLGKGLVSFQGERLDSTSVWDLHLNKAALGKGLVSFQGERLDSTSVCDLHLNKAALMTDSGRSRREADRS
eukprot:CAMPEP_0172675170 /NCGR_PEP_ID=MMETSP1074-20121228/13124_1 /TAXON_ID=2916 /ORGANISM="Ceratium fusus, Strain PA161109" /LENGTH=77 /DNA_ID=CAMNT_0013492617 /DNA_START=266 /DNA_END=496 /DNA_ORIENTATION=+